MPVRIEETEDEKKLSDRELKKACKEYARKNFQGKKYTNIDTNTEILVSREGLDKWDNITKSREQSITIKILDVILVKMKRVGYEKDRHNRRSVEGYTYYEYHYKSE
jgi:hypothetical protein